MKARVYDRYGYFDIFAYRDVDTPVVKDHCAERARLCRWIELGAKATERGIKRDTPRIER